MHIVEAQANGGEQKRSCWPGQKEWRETWLADRRAGWWEMVLKSWDKNTHKKTTQQSQSWTGSVTTALWVWRDARKLRLENCTRVTSRAGCTGVTCQPWSEARESQRGVVTLTPKTRWGRQERMQKQRGGGHEATRENLGAQLWLWH